MGNTASKLKRKSKNKSKKRVKVAKQRRNLVISPFGQLPNAIFMQILSLIDGRSCIAIKQLNGHFYHLMDPTKPTIKQLWEAVVRTTYQLTPETLKCKRWDLYFSYKVYKTDTNVDLKEYKELFDSFDQVEDRPQPNDQFMVIEGCDFDINRINKTSQYNAGDLFKGEMRKNKKTGMTIPKGIEDLKLYCPVIAYGNFRYLDYVEWRKYKCIVCKNEVHSVNTLEQAKEKLAEGKCIRVVWASGHTVLHFGGEEYQDPKDVAARARKGLKYEWDPDWVEDQ